MQLSGARDRNNPRLLGQQPSQRDLGGGHLFLFREFRKHINEGLIRFSVFRVKTRDLVAEIVAVKLRILVNLSREEAFAQGTEGNKSNSEFFQGWQHFRFRLSPPQRVFTLER